MHLDSRDPSRSDTAFSPSTGQDQSVLQHVSPPQGAKIAAALWSEEEVDQRIRRIVAEAIDHPHSPELRSRAIGLEEILALGSESEQESARVLRDVIVWMVQGDLVYRMLDWIDNEMYTITEALHTVKGVSEEALTAAPKIRDEINKLRQLSLDQLSPPLRRELEKRIQVRIECCEQILEDWGESVVHAVDKAFRYQERYGKDNEHVKIYLSYLRHVLKDKDARLSSLPDEGPVDVKAVKKAIQALKQLDRENRSWWSSCWRSVTKPEEWSDRTKNTVKNLFVAAQLSQRVIAEVEHVQTNVQTLPLRAQELQKRAIDAVPKEEKEAIQRESAYVATLLVDRFDAMKDRNTREKLTGRLTDEGKQFVTRVVEQNGSLSHDQARMLASEFELRTLIRHSPEANPYTQRMQRLQTGFNMLVGGPPDLVEQTSRAVHLLSDGQATLNDLEAMASGPPEAEIESLRQEALLLGVALARTANPPDTPCPPSSMQAWCEEVQQQCFEVKQVVQRINDLMTQARAHMPQPESDAELSLAGNKHANLIKMARVAETLQVPGVSVPRPRGIEGPAVEAHLDMYAPNVMKRWKRLEKLFQAHKDLNSPEAENELDAIQGEIAFAFRAYPLPLSKEMTSWLKELEASGNYLMVRSSGAEDSRKLANAGGNVSVSYVAPNPDAVSAALGQVIASYFGYSSLQNRINAGSNPFTETMSLGSTVQELVGEQVGGSSDVDQIPISLVLFTNEPLFVGTEEFRVMRVSASYGHGDGVVGNLGINTDTALILHSVAHPDELYILYDNQVKPERLAPVRDDRGQISLQKVTNPEQLQTRPALSEAVIRRLFQWGIIGESYFEGHPTDMEIVVKGDTIYPVQARPVNRPQILPTYLDTKKLTQAIESPLVSTVPGDVVVPGKASVVEITSVDQVLPAKTLLEAERLYDKAKHKLVVIVEPEPANSHPVVNFSALGQPCILVKDQAAVKQMLSRLDANHSLAVCMQEGTINLWDTRKGSVEAFTSQGFTVHPAKVAVSVPVTQMLPQVNTQAPGQNVSQEVPQEVTDLLLSIRSATTTEVALGHLQALRTHSWVTQLRARQQALQAGSVGVAFTANVVQSAAELDLRIQRAFSEAETAFLSSPVEHRLERLMHVKVLETLLLAPPGSHAAVGQVSVASMLPMIEDVEEMVSYTKSLDREPQFAGELRLARHAPLVEVEKEWRAFLREAEKVTSPSEAAAFRELLGQLEEMGVLTDWLVSVFYQARIRAPSAVRDFIVTACSSLPPSGRRMMYALRQHQAVFRELHDHVDRFGDPQAFQSALELLVREFTQLTPNRPIGGEEAKRQELKEWLDAIKEMDQTKMDYVIGRLRDAIWGKQPVEASLFDEWEQAGSLARVMFAQTLYQLVDLADQAIKTMKMSPHFSDQKKLEQFQKMVFSLHDFLTAWLLHIRHHKGGGLIKGAPSGSQSGPDTFVAWQRGIYKLPIYNHGWIGVMTQPASRAPLVTRYERDEWWKIVRKRDEPDIQLRSSSSFCVSGAVIGNKDTYGSIFRLPPIPLTLEDLFTLTHQDLLQVTAYLSQQERPEMLATLARGNPSSDMLMRLNEHIQSGGVDVVLPHKNGEISRFGLSLLEVMGSGDGMRFRVTSQLREHGVLYEVYCDREFKKWSVKTTVLAEDEDDRLAKMEKDLLRLQREVADRVEMSAITKMTAGVSYELELKRPDHLQDVMTLATHIGFVEEMQFKKKNIESQALFV